MRTVGIIPARLAAERLPRKPLVMLGDLPRGPGFEEADGPPRLTKSSSRQIPKKFRSRPGARRPCRDDLCDAREWPDRVSEAAAPHKRRARGQHPRRRTLRRPPRYRLNRGRACKNRRRCNSMTPISSGGTGPQCGEGGCRGRRASFYFLAPIPSTDETGRPTWPTATSGSTATAQPS